MLKKIIQIPIIFALVLVVTACENTSTSVSISSDNKELLIKGKIVDGYISGAAVYLDLNSNNYWDNKEPKVITSSDGSFNFGTIATTTDDFIPIVSVSGTDKSTNKLFKGKLRDIIDTNSVSEDTSVYVTPLTDLIATCFLELNTNSSENLSYCKKKIATAYSISEEDINKNPMGYAGVFAITQEIQQTKLLIEVVVDKAMGNDLSLSELETIRYDIKKAIISGIDTNKFIDIAKILTKIEDNLQITIPNNEKVFAAAQLSEVIRVLNPFTAKENHFTVDDLINTQVILENEQDKAYVEIKEANKTDTLDVISINVDINTQEAAADSTTDTTSTPQEDTNTTTDSTTDTTLTPQEDTKTTTDSTTDTTPKTEATPDDTMKSISFKGQVVDGYINGATVCLDINEDNLCSADEPTAITDIAGKFNFTNLEVKKDINIALLISNGTDMATNKPFLGEFKAVINTSTVSSETNLMITPLSDLATILFYKSLNNNPITIDTALQTIADGLGINKEDMLLDPMSSLSLFSKNQEIMNTELLLELVSNTSFDETMIKNTRRIIKDIIINQLSESSTLNINNMLISAEIALGINIDEEKKTFVKAQIAEIKRALDSMTVDISALNRLQYVLDFMLEDVYKNIKYKDINISDSLITQSKFSKVEAIYDEKACTLKYGYNSIFDTNATSVRVEDAKNGLSLFSNYSSGATKEDNEVTIYYPTLQSEKTGDPTIVIKENYYFSYDNAWINDSDNAIYIQIPKDKDSPYICYKINLNTNKENDLVFTKVYNYSDIILD